MAGTDESNGISYLSVNVYSLLPATMCSTYVVVSCVTFLSQEGTTGKKKDAKETLIKLVQVRTLNEITTVLLLVYKWNLTIMAFSSSLHANTYLLGVQCN